MPFSNGFMVLISFDFDVLEKSWRLPVEASRCFAPFGHRWKLYLDPRY